MKALVRQDGHFCNYLFIFEVKTSLGMPSKNFVGIELD
jgi:hypothetical protein